MLAQYYVESQDQSYVVGWIIGWAIVGGGVGFAIGNWKGRGTAGFFLGLFLGFIGWIIVAVMEPAEEERLKRAQEAASYAQAGMWRNTPVQSARPAGSDADSSSAGQGDRECPWCAETVKARAVICRFCQRDLPPVIPTEVAQSEKPGSPPTNVWEYNDGWLTCTAHHTKLCKKCQEL